MCVGDAGSPLAVAPGWQDLEIARSTALPRVSSDSADRCEERYVGDFIGLEWQKLLDSAHFLSAGVVSFARGLNDAPKIAALLLVSRFVEVQSVLLITAGAVAAGGLVSARRVALTMGKGITTMNHGPGTCCERGNWPPGHQQSRPASRSECLSFLGIHSSLCGPARWFNPIIARVLMSPSTGKGWPSAPTVSR